MTEQQPATEWTAARAEKWRSNAAGMEATLSPVDEPLIGALKLDAPCRIADIGCGGGRTTLEVLRHAPAGSVVHGFDISPILVELARSRQPEDPSVAFEVADAAIAPPPERRYDRLVSRFGVMFFNDPAAAFGNLAQWLTPDGRFAFAVWGPVADNEWFATLRQVVSETIDLPAPVPDAPGPFRYAKADSLAGVLSRAGYTEVGVSDWRGVFSVGGGLKAAEAADFALTSISTFAEQLDEAGGDAFLKVREALTARFSRYEQEGAVRMSARVHIVTGAGRR